MPAPFVPDQYAPEFAPSLNSVPPTQVLLGVEQMALTAVP